MIEYSGAKVVIARTRVHIETVHQYMFTPIPTTTPPLRPMDLSASVITVSHGHYWRALPRHPRDGLWASKATWHQR